MESERREKLNLLLKGGRVIDPANNVNAVRDVGIRERKEYVKRSGFQAVSGDYGDGGLCAQRRD